MVSILSKTQTRGEYVKGVVTGATSFRVSIGGGRLREESTTVSRGGSEDISDTSSSGGRNEERVGIASDGGSRGPGAFVSSASEGGGWDFRSVRRSGAEAEAEGEDEDEDEDEDLPNVWITLDRFASVYPRKSRVLRNSKLFADSPNIAEESTGV
jgi:hypothetical protein